MDSTKLAYIGGLVRIATSLVGGWLTQKGWSTEAEIEGIAGAIVLALTGIWSIWAKRKALQAVPAATRAALALIVCSVFLSGCAVIHGAAGDSKYTGFAFGEKASSTLAGLNITETQTEDGAITLERGVGVDKSGVSGEADLGKILGNLLLLGLQSQGVPTSSGSTAVDSSAAAVEPTVATQPTVYSTPVATTTTAAALNAKIDEAKASGKPLVVIAGSPACGFCVNLENVLSADATFNTRSDIVVYREMADWGSNFALKWTGGGSAPIMRVVQWGASGKAVCDKKVNRPQTIADIEAALSSCVAPGG